MALLEVTNLSIFYGSPRGVVRAVDGVSFEISRGQALGIVGESGSGKSSVAMGIMRLIPPRSSARYEGDVTLDGLDCMDLSDDVFRKEVRWRRMSMVFQGAMDSLNPVIRVGLQIAEPLLIHRSITKREAHLEVMRLLETVSLPHDVFYRYAHELSGGMKQRILLAMALVLAPQLIIMDEPTSALDVSVQAQIMNLIKRLKRDMGLGVLFITHDIALASDICDVIAVMYGGKIVELGPADQVLVNPKHPYSKKLLDSVPRIRGHVPTDPITGHPPNPTSLPVGCSFHPRCPYAFARCSEEEPSLLEITSGHQVRCWLMDEYCE